MESWGNIDMFLFYKHMLIILFCEHMAVITQRLKTKKIFVPLGMVTVSNIF